MTREQPPLSGYILEHIFSTRQELLGKAADADEAQHGAFQFGWDWRRSDSDVFDVRISIAVEPSAERPEYVAANVIGRFRQVSDTPSIGMEDFAGLQAVAILLPYVRQFLANLTLNSIYGVFYLPSLNVHRLMAPFDDRRESGAPNEQSALPASTRTIPALRGRRRPSRKRQRAH